MSHSCYHSGTYSDFVSWSCHPALVHGSCFLSDSASYNRQQQACIPGIIALIFPVCSITVYSVFSLKDTIKGYCILRTGHGCHNPHVCSQTAMRLHDCFRSGVLLPWHGSEGQNSCTVHRFFRILSGFLWYDACMISSSVSVRPDIESNEGGYPL